MLTRRTFLTAIIVAPLARFCRPCDHSKWDAPLDRCNSCGITKYQWLCRQWRGYHCTDMLIAKKRVEPKADVERRYALPQGTLG